MEKGCCLAKEEDAKQEEKEKLSCEGIPFIDLRDSPIFRSTAREVEGSLESMHRRTRKIIHGAEMYCRALDDAFHESLRFASLIEAQCSPKGVGGEGGEGLQEDDDDDEQERLKLGGPVISRFVQSMRELSSFIELLRTQVQIVMCDRLEHHSGQALERVKQCRKAVQQRNAEYDAVRSKHLGHRKLLSNFDGGMKRGEGEASGLRGRKESGHAVGGDGGKKLMQCRVQADEARYDLARALVEAKGQFRYELLESVANVMQAHAKYFEHGHAVAGNMSGYIDDCLEYVCALKSQSNGTMSCLEKLIEREVLLWKEHEMKLSQMEDEKVKQLYGLEEDGRIDHGPMQVTSASHELAGKIQEFIARTVASEGREVTILKQGYLLKRSSKMRGKWQRRFFVLDSTGMLYYYSTKSEGGADFVKRKEQRPQNTVNLVTAAVKKGLDAEDKQVPFSFRIVSPEREYSLQAEDEIDAQAWMDMLQGVIVSLLSGALESNATVDSPRKLQSQVKTPLRPTHSRDLSSDMSSFAMIAGESGHDVGRTDTANGQSMSPISSMVHGSSRVSILSRLSSVLGNEKCADCSASNPDWGSLNIGALYCIECSGFHRKLGVHISKIRSLTLDTRVWDDTVVQLFQHLGNKKVNDIWEGIHALNMDDDELTWSDDTGEIKGKLRDVHVLKQFVDVIQASPKPESTAPAASKEKYIHAKYVAKSFLIPLDGNPGESLWNSVESGDVLKCYKALVHASSLEGRSEPEQLASRLENEVDHMMKFGEKQDIPSTATALHYACKVRIPYERCMGIQMRCSVIVKFSCHGVSLFCSLTMF